MKSYKKVLKMLKAELVCKQHSHCQQSLGLCKHTGRGRQTFLLANIVAETTKYAKLRPANIHLARWEQINDIENNGDMVELANRGWMQYFRGRKGQQTRVCIVWLATCLSVSVIPNKHKTYFGPALVLSLLRCCPPSSSWYYLCQPFEIFLREEVDP